MKMTTKIFAVVAVLLVALAVQPAKAGGGGAEAFEKLKSLVGHWETGKTNMNKATLDLQLTSGGTAVMETFRMVDEGKSVEMITMYYLDGDQIKLTHYCMAGNQPTMRGTYAPETRTLTFAFAGATNMKTPNDGHMDHAVYTFVDNDHFKTRWTFQKDQKDTFTEDVTYLRVK